MEKRWFNSMLFNEKLKHRLSKSMDSSHAIGHTGESEEPIINDTGKNIPSLSNSYSDILSNVDHLFYIRNIWSFLSDNTFLVRDINSNSYFVYFDMENNIFESELEIFFSSYLNNGDKSNNHYYSHYMYDTLNNHITSCIDSYLLEVSIHSSISGYSDNYILSLIYNKIVSNIENISSSIITNNNNGSDLNIINNFDINNKYKHLWVQCENCYGLNYKKFFKSKLNICEHCGYHLKMSSLDRIELLIDPGTWDPMDEDMVSMDPIKFNSEEDLDIPDEELDIPDEELDIPDEELDIADEEIYIPDEELYISEEEIYIPDEEPYINRIDSYQRDTGLTEAVQTGIGQLNDIPIAIGVMEFNFMGGSMGSVVGEKITRLIEYATNQSLPVIIVCASGGARMQEGSLSLMQMAKISSASYNYQSNKRLFYVSILTSPTTGGVTASFGMLGDVIIAEPNAYIAFAGKRVIEQTLNKTVPEGSQEAEYSFHKGLFDPIVPRNPLKGVLSELFQLHGFFPLNKN
uniref:Acetyl-coenzyme A carboxylase carboxyl transferase subunit beta, chloroplastic n=1 Tax=Corsia cf. boridiensis SPL470-2 TaxID=1663393 RepID=A0A0K1H2Q9_9LILI|nr:acetyl-CoA carboxylase carboxyltransferase beta subunit [Corsia cf. boridiensis SPL470-2]